MNSAIDLFRLLNNGESQTVEFKSSFDREATRNKLIAEAFYLTNNIEKYGRGYIRIRKELETYPETTFNVEEMGDGVLVTFKQRERINKGINGGISGLYNYVKQHPGLRIPELSKYLNISSKTLERWLKQLKDDKKVIHSGSRKTGGYHATNIEEGP